MVRDISKFDPELFKTLLRSNDWDDFFIMDDVENVLLLLVARMYDILIIMCPFRSYKQRRTKTPCLTADIYKMLRNLICILDFINQLGLVVT